MNYLVPPPLVNLNWSPCNVNLPTQIPTCLLYEEKGRVLAWSLEAKNSSPMPGTSRCEWFKLFLEPQALRDESTIDPRLPSIPVSPAIGFSLSILSYSF